MGVVILPRIPRRLQKLHASFFFDYIIAFPGGDVKRCGKILRGKISVGDRWFLLCGMEITPLSFPTPPRQFREIYEFLSKTLANTHKIGYNIKV